MNRKPYSFLKFGLLIAVLTATFDQLSKQMVLALISPWEVIEITSFFNLILAWNKGISFSFLNSGSDIMIWALRFMAGGIILVLLGWLYRATEKWKIGALGLIIGGAFGNLIDRSIYSAVVDFIDWHIGNYHWPTFNLADSAITIGVGILFLGSLFWEKKSQS